jgi:hypothetical protein
MNIFVEAVVLYESTLIMQHHKINSQLQPVL